MELTPQSWKIAMSDEAVQARFAQPRKTRSHVFYITRSVTFVVFETGAGQEQPRRRQKGNPLKQQFMRIG